MRVRFDRFYTYAELTETLEAWASAFPSLFRLEAIGKSYEGRDIWLCTVTNAETGPAEEKPAVFVHAQIHAMEFTGTTAALDLLDTLLHSDDEAGPPCRRHESLLRRAAGQSRRCRGRPVRRTLAPLERAAVSA